MPLTSIENLTLSLLVKNRALTDGKPTAESLRQKGATFCGFKTDDAQTLNKIEEYLRGDLKEKIIDKFNDKEEALTWAKRYF